MWSFSEQVLMEGAGDEETEEDSGRCQQYRDHQQGCFMQSQRCCQFPEAARLAL